MLRGKVSSCHIEIHGFMCVIILFHSLDSFVMIGKTNSKCETPTFRQIFELEGLNVFERKECEKIGETCEF